MTLCQTRSLYFSTLHSRETTHNGSFITHDITFIVSIYAIRNPYLYGIYSSHSARSILCQNIIERGSLHRILQTADISLLMGIIDPAVCIDGIHKCSLIITIRHTGIGTPESARGSRNLTIRITWIIHPGGHESTIGSAFTTTRSYYRGNRRRNIITKVFFITLSFSIVPNVFLYGPGLRDYCRTGSSCFSLCEIRTSISATILLIGS